MNKKTVLNISLIILLILSITSSATFAYLFYTKTQDYPEEASDATEKKDETITKDISETKFYINKEEQYLIEKNDWKITKAYTETTNYEDPNFLGIWTMPIADYWVFTKENSSLAIRSPYIPFGTMGFSPYAVPEGFIPVEDYKATDESILMRKEIATNHYEYLFASKNEFFGITDGDTIFYPDMEYYLVGEPIIFIFQGNEELLDEAIDLIQLNIESL